MQRGWRNFSCGHGVNGGDRGHETGFLVHGGNHCLPRTRRRYRTSAWDSSTALLSPGRRRRGERVKATRRRGGLLDRQVPSGPQPVPRLPPAAMADEQGLLPSPVAAPFSHLAWSELDRSKQGHPWA